MSTSKMLLLLFFICGAQAANETVPYDAYYGTPASNEDMMRFEELNNTFWCVDKIELPCDPKAGRRLDGTCNYLKNPIRGAAHTPFARLLPAEFGPDYEPRKTKSGKPPRSARKLRTSLLSEGDIPSQVFTHLLPHFLLLCFGDYTSVHDTVNFVLWKPYCCEEKGKSDNMCAPVSIPDDDPVHQFTNIRCLNNTKPFTYQNMGCLRNNDSIPARISSATPFIDLNIMYGSEEILNKHRMFKGGLLKYEVVEDRIWPPKMKDSEAKKICLLNQPPRETRCHDTPDNGSNSLLGVNLMSIWMFRLHNYIAKELAKVNSCWDDELLFNTAVDISIALFTQMLYYDALPSLMGRDNLIRDGVISDSPGFRDEYDENLVPQTFLEFPFIGRWVHLIQPGQVEFYDTQGNYLKQLPIANLTVRTGFLAIDNNLDYITQGAFRQSSGAIDNTITSVIAERALGGLQLASDAATSDMSKNRLFGFPPYIKYRDFCSGTTHTSFEDLADNINLDMLEILQKNYESVQDIDLLAGAWLERPMDNSYVPATFYCLMTQQFLKTMKYDRHWYERPNRPNAFTYGQLLEVRKSTAAHFLCAVGDKVTEIQPRAFYRESEDNPMTPCNKIPKVNFEAWRDARCSCKE